MSKQLRRKPSRRFKKKKKFRFPNPFKSIIKYIKSIEIDYEAIQKKLNALFKKLKHIFIILNRYALAGVFFILFLFLFSQSLGKVGTLLGIIYEGETILSGLLIFDTGLNETKLQVATYVFTGFFAFLVGVSVLFMRGFILYIKRGGIQDDKCDSYYAYMTIEFSVRVTYAVSIVAFFASLTVWPTPNFLHLLGMAFTAFYTYHLKKVL